MYTLVFDVSAEFQRYFEQIIFTNELHHAHYGSRKMRAHKPTISSSTYCEWWQELHVGELHGDVHIQGRNTEQQTCNVAQGARPSDSKDGKK